MTEITPDQRILMVLGGYRDGMSAEAVLAFQKLAKELSNSSPIMKEDVVERVRPWLSHKLHCLAQRDLHGNELCYCGLDAAIQAQGTDEGLRSALEKCRNKFSDQERRIRSRYENTGCEVNLRKILELEVGRLQETIAEIDTALSNSVKG